MSEEPQILRDLHRFSVSVDIARDRTTYWVRPEGQSDPVVSMHKDYSINVAVRPYYVRPVAAPEYLLGYVKLGKAWDGQQVEIGAVGDMRKPDRMARGPIVQHGLGVLTPKRPGARGALHKVARVVDWLDFDLPGAETVDAAVSAHVVCAGPTSAGFELTRRAGATARYEVVVHDPRVSRLLVLAFLDCFNAAATDVRQVGVLFSTNPLDNMIEHRRMKDEWKRRNGL